MWLSLNWMKRVANLPEIDAQTLGNKITMSIAEVESIKQTHPHLDHVYTAKILEVSKIPETDHLQVTKIDTGEEILQVVCGANNITAGDVVPLAKVGTQLPLDEGKVLKIKKGKLKGFDSYGMLCSCNELKLSGDPSGILQLDKDLPLNRPLSTILSDTDTLFEIDNKSITHRPDLWGHLGFAREVAAITGGTLKPNYFENAFDETVTPEFDLKVKIDEPTACYRYSGLAVKNITIKPSPEWMQTHLLSVGLNPINNIVDITNFVLMELGQPMHAFDLKKLASPEITVRFAQEGESFKALDELQHTLATTHLVIADNEKAIALAGVMGGDNTKIEDETTDLILEAASFHAATVRRCAGKLGIRTDSSNRFEKSLDPENTISALKLAYHLIKESCPEAYLASELVDNYPTPYPRITIKISCSDINKKLGTEIPNDRIKTILTSLHYEIISDNADKMTIKVPTFRATKDVGIAADIVEEIGRIYGYDNIDPIPFLSPAIPPRFNQERLFERDLKNKFVNRYNFDEVYNYTFVSEDDIKLMGEDPDQYLGLRNALSQEYTKLRQHGYISALNTATVNAKQSSYFRFFEVGRSYNPNIKTDDQLATESRYLIAGIYSANSDQSAEAFYQLKEIAEDYFTSINIKGLMLSIPKEVPTISHPQRISEYKRGRDIFAKIFELHPSLLMKKGAEGRLVLLELDLNKIYSAKKSAKKFSDISKHPASHFEFTVIAPEKTHVADILNIARRSAKKLLKNVELLSIYQGNPIPEGQKAVSIKVILGSNERTLKPKEINKTHEGLIAALKKGGFELRS